MSLKNAYCRIYQSVFAPVNKIINKREPKVLRHEGAMLDIPAILQEQGIHNPMIVTGPRVSKSEHFLALCDKLGEGHYTLYNEVQPDPPISMVESMAKIYKSAGCDGIIAIGGGSNIDAAKAMGARIARPNTPLTKLGGVVKVLKEIPYFIAVPTTAGTGSECTVSSVVIEDSISKKFVISDPVLCPNVAVLDPILTVSLPANLTAYTGMDALTHAVEAYLNKPYHRAGLKERAVEAIQTIIDYLPRAFANGEDVIAREELLVASYKAGLAFSSACIGNVHAIAHACGGKYHVQHGLANAIILPHVLREYYAHDTAALDELAASLGMASGLAFIEKIESMNESFGIPNYIAEIQAMDIDEMASWCNKEANPLYPVPVIFDQKKFAEVIRKIAG